MMQILIRLLRQVGPLKGRVALAALLGSGTVASSIGLMAAAAYLISGAALHPSIADLSLIIIAVRVFGIARGVLRYCERLVSPTVSLRLLTNWRVWFYNALEPLAPARLLEYHSGDLLTRAVADIDSLQDLYVRVISPPLVALIVGAGMVFFLWQFSPYAALVLVAAWLVVGLGVPALVHRMSTAPSTDLFAQRAALHTQLVDGIQGLGDITAFGQQARIIDNLSKTEQAYEAAQVRLARINAFQSSTGTLVTFGTMLIVLMVGILAVNAGALNSVFLATLALATVAAFEAVLALPHAAQSLEQALGAGRRLFEIVDTSPPVTDPAVPLAVPPGAAIRVRDLSFTYPGTSTPALDGISLDIEPGKRVAIVGPSGGGKTTLVSLLARFWEYDRGEITLNGISLHALAQEEVRRTFSVISQQTYLFDASIADNLRLAKPDADAAAISRAAQQAEIDSFIQSLPNGYATQLGEHGANLSGGERQRLGIARALLRNTPILILDEPTANLDARTERALLRSVLDAEQKRTLLLVTHRLVEMEAMDEILVLAHGRIVERGTHAQLVLQQGVYARLWDLQNRALVAETETT